MFCTLPNHAELGSTVAWMQRRAGRGWGGEGVKKNDKNRVGVLEERGEEAKEMLSERAGRLDLFY